MPQVKNTGGLTYNPSTGELRQSGYALPIDPHRSVALDEAPSPAAFEHYMLLHQDVFDADPEAALHVHSDEYGDHFVHVVHVEADFDRALVKARSLNLPGINDIETGEHHPAPPQTPPEIGAAAPAALPEAPLDAKPLTADEVLARFDQGRIAVWSPERSAEPRPRRSRLKDLRENPRQMLIAATMLVSFCISLATTLWQRKTDLAAPMVAAAIVTPEPAARAPPPEPQPPPVFVQHTEPVPRATVARLDLPPAPTDPIIQSGAPLSVTMRAVNPGTQQSSEINLILLPGEKKSYSTDDGLDMHTNDQLILESPPYQNKIVRVP